MLEYVYNFTPSFLLDNQSLKLEIKDLFNQDSDYQAYKLLKETTEELIEKRTELLKEQREIKLGLRREDFLLKDVLTAETSDHIRGLELKNIEYESEIQSLSEENSSLQIKNQELMIYINLLNIRLKEMNQLVYDFSRDKPQNEILIQNADLIRDIDKIKSDKMMLEAEIRKYKDAVERQKIRKSKPDRLNNVDPDEPGSFLSVDGKDLFSDSFLNDNDKQLKENIEILEKQVQEYEQIVSQKQQEIEKLKNEVEELETVIAQKNPERTKTDISFDFINHKDVHHIKDLLQKFL